MPEIPLPAGEFTWTAAGAWGAFLTLCGLVVRQVVPWRKQAIDAERDFRDGLLARVERLEKQLEFERARHAAEIGVNRHRLNNVTACFDALLLLLEAAPDKAIEAVASVKKMRAEQMKAEAQEKGVIVAARIHAAGAEDVDGY